MKKIKIFLFVFIIFSTPAALAETPGPDRELIENIDITESILKVMLDLDREQNPFSGSGVSGFYLKGYGIIVKADYISGLLLVHNSFGSSAISGSGSVQKFVFNPKKELKGEIRDVAPKSVSVSRFSYSPGTDAEGIPHTDPIPALKDKIIRYYKNYAPALTGLKPEEKITISINLKGFPSSDPDSPDTLPARFTATVSMGDILDSKKAGDPLKELTERITFSKVMSVDEETRIFSGVINNSIRHMDSGFGSRLPESVKGMYIPSYGSVFMTDVDFGIMAFILQGNPEGPENKKPDISVFTELFGKNAVKINADFKNYEGKLIRLISGYGHTLSKIKPDEWLVIALNFNGIGMIGDISKGIIKVKKSDITSYNSGTMDFSDFKKKVDISYY